MAGDLYTAQIDPSAVGGAPLPSAEVSTAADRARIQQGAAIGGLGSEVLTVAGAFSHAQKISRMSDATTQALRGFNDLETRYTQDTDFATALPRFKDESNKLVGDILSKAGLPPQYAEQLKTRIARMQISSESAVQKAAWGREQSSNVANLGQQEIGFQQQFLKSGTDAERAAVYASQSQAVDDQVKAGWITAAAGQQTVQRFRANTEQAQASKMIADDPAAAQEAFKDAARFPNMSPTTRAALAAQADAARDQQASLQVGLEAKRDPAKAAAMVGFSRDPATVAHVFNKGLIPQESGSNPDTPDSPKGAAGLTQMIPDTARAAARRAGVPGFDQMSDEEVRQRLRSDAATAHRLGLNEFQMLADRYGGSIPAALAGYNAGPGNDAKPRADAWHRQALEKFGPNYSAEQFASLIPIKETRDYVLKVYERLGAPASGVGLSYNGQMRAQSVVAGEMASQDRERISTLQRLAALGRDSDSIVDLLKAGYSIDPGRLSAYRQTLTMAAQSGDAASARELRRLDFAESIAPVVRQAYAMPPSQLEAAVAQQRQRLAQSPDVSGFEKDRLDALEAVLNTVNTQKSVNPVGLAERAGMFRATPIPTGGDTSAPDFQNALRDRGLQAEAAARAYDGHLVPFTPAEAAALKNQWAQGGPTQKVALAGALSANMSPGVAEAALRQIGGSDRQALTAGLIAQRDPRLAVKILEGAALLETPGVKPKVGDVREALRGAWGGQTYVSPALQSDAVEAALAVYAADRGGKGSLFDPSDRSGLEAAIKQVTGETIKINGRKTAITPGFAPGAVSRGIANMTAEDFAPFGGLDPKLDPAWLAGHAQLQPLKIGGAQYLMTAGDRPVFNAAGRPMVIDLAVVAEHQRQRRREAWGGPDAVRNEQWNEAAAPTGLDIPPPADFGKPWANE